MPKGDFVRSANPNDPEWEKARIMLVVRLMDLGLESLAGQVKHGEPASIDSWIALEFIATALVEEKDSA